MPITPRVVQHRTLTIFTAVGEVTLDDQIAVLKTFYEGEPTPNVLWDMRAMEGKRISSKDIQKILDFIERHGKKRPPGKTAFVTATELDFGLSNMSSTMAGTKLLPWKMRAFLTVEEATRWLDDPLKADPESSR